MKKKKEIMCTTSRTISFDAVCTSMSSQCVARTHTHTHHGRTGNFPSRANANRKKNYIKIVIERVFNVWIVDVILTTWTLAANVIEMDL